MYWRTNRLMQLMQQARSADPDQKKKKSRQQHEVLDPHSHHHHNVPSYENIVASTRIFSRKNLYALIHLIVGRDWRNNFLWMPLQSCSSMRIAIATIKCLAVCFMPPRLWWMFMNAVQGIETLILVDRWLLLPAIQDTIASTTTTATAIAKR